MFQRLLSFTVQVFDVDTDPCRGDWATLIQALFSELLKDDKGCWNHYIDSAPFSPGVPDRYHLRPDLGRHPSALQQQQHQHAHSDPQQVHSQHISPKQTMGITACPASESLPFPKTIAAIEFQHCHTVNNSLGSSVLPSQEDACD